MTPPTLEQVLLHAAKIGLVPVEAEKFHAYYESNGWRVGKNPMKIWQAAMTSWRLRCQCDGSRQAAPGPTGPQATNRITAVDKMAFMHELKIIEGRIANLRGSYSEHQSMSEEDRTLLRRLKSRKAALHILLGFQV